MSLKVQYYTDYKSDNFKELARFLTEEEYREVVDCLEALNLKNGWIQAHSEYWRRLKKCRNRMLKYHAFV